jgi:hypothetical protein
MSTNTMEDNLSWLEHETKINSSLSTVQEMKAKLNVLSLAVSSIADLTATVKELKNENLALKSEIIYLKSEIERNKNTITDEEQDIIRQELTEKFNEFKTTMNESTYGIDWITDELINKMLNVIINKSKTFEQCYRVTQKLKDYLKTNLCFNLGYSFRQLGGAHLYYSKDYKIIYFALYEMYRQMCSKCPNYSGKHHLSPDMLEIFKSIEDGGIDISSIKNKKNIGRDSTGCYYF